MYRYTGSCVLDGTMADGFTYLNTFRCVQDITKLNGIHRGADKSLALPGRKQATATEDFDVHISYL